MPAVGKDSYLAFGGEVSNGAASPTLDLFLRILSENMAHQKDTFTSEELSADWHDAVYYRAGRNAGDIAFEMNYTGFELLLHSLLGTYTYSVDTPVAGTNFHVFTHVPATNSYPAGIAGQVVRGLGTSQEMTYLGQHVSKMVFEFANGQIVRVTVTFAGTGYEQGAATSPTFPTKLPVLPAHKSTLTLGGNTVTILNGTVTVELPLADDREHYGETLYKEALRRGRPMCTFSLDCELDTASGANSMDLYEDYLEENEITGLVLTHQGDIITGATRYQFSINATKAWITGDSPSVQDSGVVPITINGRVTDGLSLSLINATAQVT